MLKKFFGKSDEPKARVLSHPSELAVGDMLTFKPRSELPEELQGATVTVRKVQAYQYSDGMVPEFVIDDTNGNTYTLALDDEEEGDFLTLSKKLGSQEVEEIFLGDDLAELWEENFPVFGANKSGHQQSEWLADKYRQTVKEAAAYFYSSDRRQSGISEYEDDSEELRYHECEGSDDSYSLNVEIWGDGSTEFFAQVTVPLAVVEEMWPNG